MLRTVLVCGFVLLCSAGVALVEMKFDVSIRQPAVAIDSLPETLSGWSSEDVPMDPEVTRFAGAEATVSRVYRRNGEIPVSVYAAVWADEETVSSIAPHPPGVCYPNAGWTLEREKVVVVDDSVPIQLLEFSRAGEHVITAHWYQLGELRYVDRDKGRLGLASLWGESSWPPLVKILLQTQASSIEEAESRLTAIATDVNQFTKTVQ
ncbi:exosortase C-terminal domain/associated protein EpsI [Bremerella cremea]|uniref:exosortase C-terminal domain/associated protein EpsI n=1 Tax=Bremerella cremea TaxID=1031537 RepID=UPI0013141265|nr:exosortase C-terminal domain/associated protein EpsI [Bremerella cremea]